MDAWKLAEQAVKELPPYLIEGELTAERLYQKHKGMLHNADDARAVLEQLVKAGKLRTEDRRNPKGGGKIKVYVEL